MAQCPSCGASIKEDYGMVTCDSCRAILFVDMDGSAHMSIDESDSSMADHETPTVNDPEFAPQPLDFLQPIEVLDHSDESDSVSEPHVPSRDSSFAEETTGAEPFSSGEDGGSPASGYADEGQELDMDQLLGYASAAEPDADEEPVRSHSGEEAVNPVESPIGSDPLGLSRYANSELSQAKDGMLVFTIHVSGIDSKEMRESLREVMSDSRFEWNTDEIMASISKGELKIENVTPVKASVLVNRIKGLPVRIWWEQYAITQMDASGET